MARDTSRTEAVRPDLAGMELKAISLLLHHWASPQVVENRKAQWAKKLPLFRKGIMAGQGSGTKETWPWELVVDEHGHVLAAVEQVKQRDLPKPNDIQAWLCRQTIVADARLPTGGSVCVERPFPSPAKYVDRHFEADGRRLERERAIGDLPWRRSAKYIALQVAAARLAVSVSRVKEALGRERHEHRRFDPQPFQKLLASLFLDLASEVTADRDVGLLASILDALYLTRYHCLALVYLVQTAHGFSPARIYLGKHRPAVVRQLTEKVLQSVEKSTRPFAKVLSGRRPR